MSVAGLQVAIIGATGMVGSTLLSILEERQFPIDKLFLLASERSVGEIRDFNGESHFIENIAYFNFAKTQLCFFCAGNDIAAEYAPKAAALGNIIIDKSSYFRYDPDIPLIVPEVNANALINYSPRNIIASPNCNTIPLVMALKPIYDAVGITRINIATYQAVSGTGKDAVTELVEQTKKCLSGQPVKSKVYPQQIAFNVLPHCDHFEENGYTKEEMKIVWETHKIFADKTIAINPTAVRVPVFYGHSAAVHLETREKITPERVIKLLKSAPGIKLNIGKLPYSTPVQDAAGEDAVYVGRIRKDISFENGLDLWIVADNVRKGAALNAIQIAEKLISMEVFK
jgi:aspartate-semialdehyde dehydrogenase